MVRIVSDTSTLYSPAEAAAAGFSVSPLSVTIGGASYREFEEIGPAAFVAKIREGHLPTSSQPSIGAVAELYAQYAGDEILNISMAQGLSGTYDSAVAARALDEHPERITVLNSRTLCGPHRYLVELAAKMAQQGSTVEEIVREVKRRMANAKSFLVPADFEYLRRGGRLSPLVSYVGKAAGLAPVMTQTEDGGRLTIASVRRGFKHAVKYIAGELEKRGVGKGWRVYITHADAMEMAVIYQETLRAALPEADFEIYPLSPAFITQGGPGCIAVQVVEL
jgi:DegV family protein with EDD domain